MLTIPEGPTRRLVRSIHRHPYLYLLAGVLLTAVMLNSGRSLKLKSKIQDLLPTHAPSVQAMEILQKRLGSSDILVVTLMAGDFDPVKRILPELAAKLEAHPKIARVVWKQDIELIDRNALTIFPTTEELQDYLKELSDTIRAAIKARLDLFGDDQGDGAPRRTFTWGEWEDDDGLSNFARTFRKERGNYSDYFYNRDYTTVGVQVFPTEPSGDLAFCRMIIEEVDALVRAEVERRLGPIGEGQTVERIDIGGGYRSALESSKSIQGDLKSSAIFSLVLLTLVVVVFFRSVRAFFCVMIPLVMATAWLVGVVALTVGYLNLVTAFIFAVLLGLGIDFGIHFYSRFREERAAGLDLVEAMVQTHLHCGEASVLAALTTCGAFLALTLADFRGFSQFGGVAAVGIVFCLLAYFVIFPSVVYSLERWVPLRLLGYKVERDEGGEIPRASFPLGRITVLVAIALGVAGAAWGVRGIEFELDFDRLGTRVKSQRSDYDKIQNGTVKSTVPAVILANSSEEAKSLYEQIERRLAENDPDSQIKTQQALFALVPRDQQEKQRLVKKICRKLRRKVKIFEGDQRDGADELLRHCDPIDFEVKDLPEWVRSKFTDRDGKLGEFIFVAPRGSISHGAVALAFRKEMLALRGLDGKPPMVSGKPMIWSEVLIAMRVDGLKTSIASLVVVLLLLYLFQRKIAQVAVILLPLAVALGTTAGLMALLGVKLNFFNMLALPTMIGMGVDNGVHVYHRYQELGPGSTRYVLGTTGMAAFLTTLTTAIGFGSLLTANHYGLNSLGFLTIVGMVLALVATLLVLPAALQWTEDRRARRGQG